MRIGIAFARLGLPILLGVWGGCSETPPAPPSVLLVTLDTTRVDHLSCFGYERKTTPRLDALAEQSVRFRHAWSTSSWTLPAHASLFTGLFPSRHGARYRTDGAANLGDRVRLPTARFVRAGKLPEETTTLAELLAGRGYRTGAFVAGPWLHRDFGLLQGFEMQDDDVQGFGGRPADEVTDAALEWLDGLDDHAPYLLFANYFDPHGPYAPQETYADLPRASEPFAPDYDALMKGTKKLDEDQQSILRDRYDAEIRWMDRHLGRLLEAVLARPGGDRTLIIVTADHGESFGEEGRFGHGFWLSEELLRIPLLVRFPEKREAGTWSEATVQLVDLLPLIASELGFSLPEGVEGVAVGKREVAFAEIYPDQTTVARFGERFDRALAAAIAWPYKLERSDDGAEVLSRLSEGTLGEAPAADEGVHERLSRLIGEHISAGRDDPIEALEVDEQLLEALRRLGYIE